MNLETIIAGIVFESGQPLVCVLRLVKKGVNQWEGSLTYETAIES